MAEKTIGIRINLNGLNGVVKDIQTLEKFIQEAREDLKQLEIGSENFNKLSAEISKATGQLQGLNRQAESLSPEKITEGFGKLAGGITSSFAAATAAVSLFGNESESVQKAATQAQNLLTLALSVRGIMEIKTGAQIVARTIAEKASTAATLATNTATKTLYTTLAANPYGALIAAIGLLVGALVALGSESDELGKSIEEINKKYDEAKIKNLDQISTITALREVILDTTQSEKRRQQGLDDLKKIMPEVTAKTLDEKDALNQVIDVSNVYIKVLKARAEAEVANAALVEASKLLIEEQAKGVRDQINTVDDFTTFLGALFTLQDAKQARLNAASERYGNNLSRIYEIIGNAEKRRDETLKTLLDAESELSELQKKNTDNEKARKNALDQTAIAQKKYTDAALTRIAVENEQLKVLIETTKKLAEVNKISPPDPKVIQALEQIVSLRKSLIEQQSGKPFSEILDAAGFKVEGGKIISSLKEQKDEFGLFYEAVRKDLSALALDAQTNVQQFVETTDILINDLERKLKKGLITPQAFKAFVEIRDQYKQFKEITDGIPNFSKVVGVEGLTNILDAFKGIQVSIGGISFEFDKVTGKVKEAKVSQEGYTASLKTYNTELQKLTDNLTSEYTKIYDAQGQVNEGVTKGLNLTQEQLKQLDEAAKKSDIDRQELIKQLVNARVEAFKKVVTTIVEEENVIRGFLFKAQQAQVEGTKLEGEAYRAVILQNLDAVQKFTKTVINEKATEKDQLLQLEKSFATAGIDITKFTEEEKLKIIKEFLEKQKKATEPKSGKGKKSAKDIVIPGTDGITLQDVADALNQFSSLVGRTASLVAQSYAFQLKQLQDTSDKALEAVVGDTDEANKKRLELEKQYQKQKAEIEKRAQVRSLQFQLAQAIADGAQAVISVIEIPPLALAVGILAAAQVALIAQQLAYVQSLAGGGRIKMGAGGMVMGPTHEYGGVSYANGVNLEGGESVINRQSSLNYGGLLSTINQSGGGAPLINNASGSLMEERLLQAIAKTKSEPIRAYVLSSEITNSQAINRRLDELSTI